MYLYRSLCFLCIFGSEISNGLVDHQGDDKFGLIDDADIEGNMGSFSFESMGIWVPQAPRQIDRQIRLFQDMKEATNINETSRSSRSRDDNFLVPQISPSSIGSKRSRLLW